MLSFPEPVVSLEAAFMVLFFSELYLLPLGSTLKMDVILCRRYSITFTSKVQQLEDVAIGFTLFRGPKHLDVHKP